MSELFSFLRNLDVKLPIALCIGLMIRVLANGLGDHGSIPRLSHTKDSKYGT